MARKGPAVVQGPHDWKPCLGEVSEQNRIVNVVAMNIMEADYIRLERVDQGDGILRGTSGTEPVPVSKTTLRHMREHTQVATDLHQVRAAT